MNDYLKMKEQIREANQLGARLFQKGRYAECIAANRRAFALMSACFGSAHPLIADVLSNLGKVHLLVGDRAEANDCFGKALTIRQKNPESISSQEVASSLSDLASVSFQSGDLARALSYGKQALEILERTVGPNHPETASQLRQLADLKLSLGDLEGAFNFGNRAAEYYHATMDVPNIDHALFCDTLGRMMAEFGGDLIPKAPALFRRAAKIYLELKGPECPERVKTLSSLSGIEVKLGHLEDAKVLQQEILAFRQRTLEPEHPDLARSLGTLGAILLIQGDLSAAQHYLNQAFRTFQENSEINRENSKAMLSNLAVLKVRQGMQLEALSLLLKVRDLNDRIMIAAFSVGSENARAGIVLNTRGDYFSFLSLVSQRLPEHDGAVRACYDGVLRRKGILADAHSALRDDVLSGRCPQMKAQFQRWVALRNLIARKTLEGPSTEPLYLHRQRLEAYHQERRDLETELASQIPEVGLAQRLQTAGSHAVTAALPDNTALIDFVRFLPFNYDARPKQVDERTWETNSCWDPARYLAFVLTGAISNCVDMIDLGEAAAIDALVAEFRAEILSEREFPLHRNMVRPQKENRSPGQFSAGAKLRAAVFDKLRPFFEGRTTLLISPDSALARVPFGILPVGQGHLLIDDFHISYLNSGRDVFRFGTSSTGASTEAIVVADPDFNLERKEARTGFFSKLRGKSTVEYEVLAAPGGTDAAGGIRRLSRDFTVSKNFFDRLPGTAAEGTSIATLLGVKPWLGAAAMEGRLKEACRSPRILHLATHGFFLEDQPSDPDVNSYDFDLLGNLGGGRLSGPLPENPLLRSGLALAGANTWLRQGSLPPETEDGLLTAEDVSGLDLVTTELVVLSACETGLGDVRTGEGVFGLQRAFMLAGAKTLVMSLWSVPDEPTRELMEDFYRRILSGGPRADALRAAQLALRTKYPDPFYWGAFICQGDPGPLQEYASPS